MRKSVFVTQFLDQLLSIMCCRIKER